MFGWPKSFHSVLHKPAFWNPWHIPVILSHEEGTEFLHTMNQGKYKCDYHIDKMLLKKISEYDDIIIIDTYNYKYHHNEH